MNSEHISRVLNVALLVIHLISVLLEKKKANDFKKNLGKIDHAPQYLRDGAEIYASFLSYVSFALLAIHASVI